MGPEILPDSRARETRGRIFTPGGAWVPVFCANCGVHGGSCPEENMTFMFYLCNRCAETHGKIAGTLMMPDELFYEKLRLEQMDSYGRYLTEQELVTIVQEDASPLATLLKSGH